MKFAAIKFLEEEQFCTVSERWLTATNGTERCFFPSAVKGKGGRDELKRLINNHTDPAGWEQYDCKVYGKYDSYTEAEKEIIRLINATSTETDTDCEVILAGAMKLRKRRHANIFEDDFEDDIDQQSSTVPKNSTKTCGKENFLPKLPEPRPAPPIQIDGNVRKPSWIENLFTEGKQINTADQSDKILHRKESPSRHNIAASPSRHSIAGSPRRHSIAGSPRRHSRKKSSSRHSSKKSPSRHSSNKSPSRHSSNKSPSRHSSNKSPSRHSSRRSRSRHSSKRSRSNRTRDYSHSKHRRSRSRSRHSRNKSHSRRSRSKSRSRHTRKEDRRSRYTRSKSLSNTHTSSISPAMYSIRRSVSRHSKDKSPIVHSPPNSRSSARENSPVDGPWSSTPFRSEIRRVELDNSSVALTVSSVSRQTLAGAGSKAAKPTSAVNNNNDDYLHDEVAFRRIVIQGLAGIKGMIARKLPGSILQQDPDLKNLVARLPMTSVTELKKLNDELQASETELVRLVTYLSQYGGEDVGGATRAALRRIVSDQVQMLYSWEGQKKKERFDKLSAIVKVVNESVRTHFSKATETVIKGYIIGDLRNAKQRCETKKKKKDQDQNRSGGEEGEGPDDPAGQE